MGKTAIKVENLSKIYRLGEIGTGTVSRDLERWFRMNVLNQDDPFLQIGQTNDRATKGDSNVVYSLQDLNFDIQAGDAVGIIGKNGAGKSTLLKILSRVTAPSVGSVKVKGRVASLLEVGTGFHPELTGKENIYLNGAILGMTKKEITRKLDEIIDFSGVERYVDTPVKRYSSGMYVRLAFAVAAHLESEILIVDEVLAVGDAEFQRKCLGKMGEVSKNEGRTILFVSHNMNAVNNLCKKGIVLSNGTMAYQGNAESSVHYYLNNNQNSKGADLKHKEVSITALTINSRFGDVNTVEAFERFQLTIEFEIEKGEMQDLYLGVFFKDAYGSRISSISNWLNSQDFKAAKKNKITVDLTHGVSFREGNYSVDLEFFIPNKVYFENALSFEVINSSTTGYKKEFKSEYGNVYVPNKIIHEV
ncbi:ABC transporter ATP-binding protein [Algoriphagus sp. H41]|uniref:ABC transporter ATP-binding protein n=1 Tax=Algoriphagus oliviformis TaxID=2811231 RepID=A0ABS3C716_9BACT|nr:ABC transporter ATP-binding protein [Algoriphagus oliviformis]MBN7812901.1 ABC transporter ATP-binding protein [Algoriphagus oliviformis]